MLGGEKRFNDLLSWVLTLPLSALACGGAAVVFTAIEVALEGDSAGSAAGAVRPWAGLGCGYAAVLAGAQVAPARKLLAAGVLAGLYGAGAAGWALFPAEGSRLHGAFAAGVWAGAAAAVWRARGLKPESGGNAGAKEKAP